MIHVQNDLEVYDLEEGGSGAGGNAISQQPLLALSLAQCYGYAFGINNFLGTNNTCAQVNYAQLTGGVWEFYASVSINSGFGTDYATNVGPQTPMFEWVHALGNSLTDQPRIIYPLDPLDSLTIFTQSGQAGTSGLSDEPSIFYGSSLYNNHVTGVTHGAFYFSIKNNTVSFLSAPPDIAGSRWAKHGDFLYVCDTQAGFEGLWKYQVSTGIVTPNGANNPPILGPVGPLTQAGNRVYSGIRVTDNFLWLFDINNGVGSQIFKCDHNGNVLATFPLHILLGFGGIAAIDVVNDSRAWIWAELDFSDFVLYYMDFSDGIVHTVNNLSPNYSVPPNPTCSYGNSDFITDNQLIAVPNGKETDFFTAFRADGLGNPTSRTARLTLAPA